MTEVTFGLERSLFRKGAFAIIGAATRTVMRDLVSLEALLSRDSVGRRYVWLDIGWVSGGDTGRLAGLLVL